MRVTQELLHCKSQEGKKHADKLTDDDSVGIPIAAYAYCGVEIVAVAAVEARNPRSSLRFPARWIAYITSLIYIPSIVAFCLDVGWTDHRLETLTDHPNINVTSINVNVTSMDDNLHNATAPLILGTVDAGARSLAGFLNAALILAILSAANTALYGKSFAERSEAMVNAE